MHGGYRSGPDPEASVVRFTRSAAIACGAFVFDEVPTVTIAQLFGELLRFLKVFRGAPVLIMSASIPPGRLQRFWCAAGDRMNGPIRGKKSLERLRRYRIDSRESRGRLLALHNFGP